jgi:hypothetical protein
MAEREPEEGRKGGAMESGMALPRHYEHAVTAVAQLVAPATRIQWGPTFAGVVVALATTLLFTSLGVALGLGVPGLGYWAIAFASVGLLLGSMLTARTAKAELPAAIVHSVIVWGIVLILSALSLGGVGGALAAAAVSPVHLIASAVIANFGWRFFIGFVIMLAASIIGAVIGADYERHQEEQRT